ncbi:MAG: hypothetical protein DGJ47_000274 [Rickettsiaceae bacterium]
MSIAISFTLENVENYLKQQKSKEQKKATRHLEDLLYFQPEIPDEGIKSQIEKDFKREINLYVQQDGDLKDLKAEKLSADKDLKFDQIVNAIKSYGLSSKQAMAIASTAHQGSISGGLTGFSGALGNLYASIPLEDMDRLLMTTMNRNGNLSKMTLNKDSSVSHSGAQRITFDCPKGEYEDPVKKFVHTEYRSKDYLTANITMRVEKNGKYTMAFDLAATGPYSTMLVKEFSSIPHKKTKTLEQIDNEYQQFNDLGEFSKAAQTKYEQKLEDVVQKETQKSKPNNNLLKKLSKLKTAHKILEKKSLKIKPNDRKTSLQTTKIIAEKIVRQVDNTIIKQSSSDLLTPNYKQKIAKQISDSCNKLKLFHPEKLQIMTSKIIEVRIKHHEKQIARQNQKGFINYLSKQIHEIWDSLKQKSPFSNKEAKYFNEVLGNLNDVKKYPLQSKHTERKAVGKHTTTLSQTSVSSDDRAKE